MKKELDWAIAFIKECKQIHVDWAKFQEQTRGWKKLVKPKDIGDAKFHRKCERQYRKVLKVLNAFKDES